MKSFAFRTERPSMELKTFNFDAGKSFGISIFIIVVGTTYFMKNYL